MARGFPAMVARNGVPVRTPKSTGANAWFIRARLRTRHLLLLTAIGEEGNIYRAAELLDMSQPAASRLLRDLEEIIGTELFERLPRGVRANDYGKAVIRYSRLALDCLSEAAAEVDRLKAGHSGQVIIGTIPGPAIGFLPELIASVVKQNPRIQVSLHVDSSSRLLAELQEGRIDLMIGRLLDRASNSELSYERLAREPVCLAVRRAHRLIGQPGLALADLLQQPWILPPADCLLRQRFELLCRDSGLTPPSSIIEAASPPLVVRLLEETDHVSVLTRSVAAHYADCGRITILPVPIHCGLDPFGIILRKGALPSPAARLILDSLRSHAAEWRTPDECVA